jgi:hypothetical protein
METLDQDGLQNISFLIGYSKFSMTVDCYGQSAKRQASQRTAAIMEEAFPSVENL